MIFPTDIRYVAFAGDWHANTPWAKRMIEALPSEVQVIVHTGDFGYLFDEDTLDDYQRYAFRADLIIMFVDGNHEDLDWLLDQPIDPESGVRVLRDNVWHLPRGYRWEWLGMSFLALGGASSIDKAYRKEGVSWWPQEVITREQADAVMADGPADIMICHDTPAGYEVPGLLPSSMWSKHRLQVCADHRLLLREIVKVVRPAYIWHGHYHSRYQHHLRLTDTIITGLNCDGSTFSDNMQVVDLDWLREESTPL